MSSFRFLLASLITLIASHCLAAGWVRVPEDYPTITEGLAALAPDGGTLYLSGGPYVEDISHNTALANWTEGCELTIEGDGAVVWYGMLSIGFSLPMRALTVRGVNFANPPGGYSRILLVFQDAVEDLMDDTLLVENCSFLQSSRERCVQLYYLSQAVFRNCQFYLVPDAVYNGTKTFCAQDVLSLSLSDCAFFDDPDPAAPITRTLIEIGNTRNPNSVELAKLSYRSLNPEFIETGEIQIAAWENVRITGCNVPKGRFMLQIGGDAVCEFLGNWAERFSLRLATAAGGTGGSVFVQHNRLANPDVVNPFNMVADDAGTLKATITDNTFSHYGTQYAFQLRYFRGENLTVENNNFLGERVDAQFIVPPIDFRFNYWDDPSGPLYSPSNPGGTGAYLAGPSGILIDPWLSAPVDIGLEDFLGQGAQPEEWPFAVNLTANTLNGTPPLQVQLKTAVGGGTPPYQYTWFINERRVAEGTSPTLSWTFDQSDVNVVRVAVEDAAGALTGDSLGIDSTGERGKIWGNVRDADTSAPLETAVVTVMGPAGDIVAVTDCGLWGDYVFDDLPTGAYQVVASESEHKAETFRTRLQSVDDRRQLDFFLDIPLDDQRYRIKADLIQELLTFPAGDYAPASPSHPYDAIEAQAGVWLNEQTSVTEELARMELAEFAVKDAAQQALMLGGEFGDEVGAIADQIVGLLFAFKQVTNVWNERMPAIFGFNEVSQKWLSVKLRRLLSQFLYKISGQVASPAMQLALQSSIEEAIKEINGQYGVAKYLKASNLVSGPFKAAFLGDYGEKTEYLLAEALNRARNEGPYEDTLEESRLQTRLEVRTMQAKTNTTMKYVGNLGWVADMSNFSHGTAGYVSSVLEAADKTPNLLPLLKAFEVTMRIVQIEMTGGSISMLYDRLLHGLPADLDQAVYATFGVVGGSGRYATASASPLPSLKAGLSTQVSRQALSVPSTDAIANALEACRTAVNANDLAALAGVVESQLIPALDGFEQAAEVAMERAGLGLPPTGGIYAQLLSAWAIEAVASQLAIAATMDYLVQAQNFANSTSAEYLDLTSTYLERLDALSMACDQYREALIQGDAAMSTGTLPAYVVCQNLGFFAGGEPVSWVDDSIQPLSVHAEITNIGDADADAFAVGLYLPEWSGLTLEGSATTQTLSQLGAGASQTLFWNLDYNGPAYDHLAYAQIRFSIGGSGTDSLTFGPPVFAILGTAPYPDQDHDGMDDRWEVDWGLSASNPTDHLDDLDGDGLLNGAEFEFGTTPTWPDTDGDEMGDGYEINHYFNPLEMDGDDDPDGDGLSNLGEMQQGIDPRNADSDKDGYSDGLEVDAFGAPNNPAVQPVSWAFNLAALNRLLCGWEAAGLDRAVLDANRNGQLDIGDFVKLLGGNEPPTLSGDCRVDLIAGPFGRQMAPSVEVHLSPVGSFTAFLVEVQFDPDEVRLTDVVSGAALASANFRFNEPQTGSLILIGYVTPPGTLGAQADVARLHFLPTADSDPSADLVVQCVRAQIADGSGQCIDALRLNQFGLDFTKPLQLVSLLDFLLGKSVDSSSLDLNADGRCDIADIMTLMSSQE